jgi:hypothetical protein
MFHRLLHLLESIHGAAAINEHVPIVINTGAAKNRLNGLNNSASVIHEAWILSL